MATFEYKLMTDFVAFQLLRYTDLNDLKNNLRYFAEDILDIDNADALPGYAMHLKLGNGSVGGTIYWEESDDTIKLEHDNADTLELHNTDLNLLNELYMTAGDRRLLCLDTMDSSLNSSGYIGDQSTDPGGFSFGEVSQHILGVSFIVKTTSFSSAGTITPRIRENGANFIALSDLSIDANDTIYSGYATYAIGTHVTNAATLGFGYEPYLEFNSGTFTVKAACMVEVVSQ